MDLGAMYDQAALDLSDRVASQRSAYAASQQQQLLDIALASKQGEIGRYEADSAARGAAGRAQASGQGQIDLAQLQGQLQGTQSAEQSAILDAFLGSLPNTIGGDLGATFPGFVGSALGAAQGAGFGDAMFGLLTKSRNGGLVKHILGDGTEIQIDPDLAARLDADVLSDAQKLRIPVIVNGQPRFATPSELNAMTVAQANNLVKVERATVG
jgi:hypothetical protein